MSGIQDFGLAIVLWVIAIVWGTVALLTLPAARRWLPQPPLAYLEWRQRRPPHSTPATSEEMPLAEGLQGIQLSGHARVGTIHQSFQTQAISPWGAQFSAGSNTIVRRDDGGLGLFVPVSRDVIEKAARLPELPAPDGEEPQPAKADEVSLVGRVDSPIPSQAVHPVRQGRLSRREQQITEFESEGRSLVQAANDLEEQLRAVSEKATESGAVRYVPQVENYEGRVEAFLARWGDVREGILNIARLLGDHGGPNVVVLGPAWRRDLVQRIVIARNRVERRLKNLVG